MIIVEALHAGFEAVVVYHTASAPLYTAHAVKLVLKVDEALPCRGLPQVGLYPQRISGHAEGNIGFSNNDAVEPYLPLAFLGRGVGWHGIAQRHVEAGIIQLGRIYVDGLLAPVDAAAF